MTLLERLNEHYANYGEYIVTKHDLAEFRRALAIAQAVEELADHKTIDFGLTLVMRRADELLEGK